MEVAYAAWCFARGEKKKKKRNNTSELFLSMNQDDQSQKLVIPKSVTKFVAGGWVKLNYTWGRSSSTVVQHHDVVGVERVLEQRRRRRLPRAPEVVSNMQQRQRGKKRLASASNLHLLKLVSNDVSPSNVS